MRRREFRPPRFHAGRGIQRDQIVKMHDQFAVDEQRRARMPKADG
jgi:hypothetical protein